MRRDVRLAGRARAQDFDEPPARRAGNTAREKTGGETSAAEEKATRAAGSFSLAPPEDPVVAALLASNPTTPSEVFHTAQLLLQAGRPELAKKFLKRLLDAKLDGLWAALVHEFHTPAFTELADRSELRPENEVLIHTALTAVNRRLHDPARLAELVAQLQNPSAEVRGRAMEELQSTRGAAVNTLVAMLADPQRAAEHAAVRTALAAMRGDAVGPLADILQQADPELMVQAIKTLTQMRATQATVYLFAPALSEQSDPRVRAAAREAIVHLMGRLPTKAQAARSCTIWRDAISPASKPCRAMLTAA